MNALSESLNDKMARARAYLAQARGIGRSDAPDWQERPIFDAMIRELHEP